MFSIIRKDLGWLLIFLILGLVQFITLLMGRPFEDLWIRPDCAPFMDLHRLCSLGGLILGVFVAIREEISRTEEYVRHRPVSPLRLYWVKVLGCILVMLAWLIIPTFLSLSRGFWSDNAQFTRYSMIMKYIGTGAVAFSSFSVGLFAGTLRLSLIKRIIIGILGYISLMYLSYILTMQTLNEGATSIFVYLCVHFTVLFLLLYAGSRNSVPTSDLDRPGVRRTIMLSGTITVFFVTIISGSWISDQQDHVHGSLFNKYPSILRSSEPKLINRDRNLRLKNKYVEVNEKHEPVREFDYPKDKYDRQHFPHHWKLRTTNQPLFKDGQYPYRDSKDKYIFGEEVLHFDQGWKCLHILDHLTNLYIYKPNGMVHYYRHIKRDDHVNSAVPRAKMLGRGPSNEPFSQNISSLSSTLPRESFMILDEDNEIWFCDLNNGDEYFRRLSLPDGDRYKWHRDVDKSVVKNFDVDVGYGAPYYGNIMVINGESDNYVWNGNQFVKVHIEPNIFRPRKQTALRSPIDRLRYCELEDDPITPEVAIKDDEGKVLFTHRFDMYRNNEIWLGLKLYAYSFLRSPVIQLISYFGLTESRDSFRSEFLIDPLLASQKRFWLLATNLLFSSCLVFLAVWRLIRFNAERNRLIYWGILIFLSGIGGYLVYRLFEPKRAYRKSKVVLPEEAPPLLICSEHLPKQVAEEKCREPALV